MPVPFTSVTGIAFALTGLLALVLFARAWPQFERVLFVGALWMVVQAGLALAGFYAEPFGIPPRFALAIGPGVLLAIVLLTSSAGKKRCQQADLRTLTLLHAVRLPVELLLHRLADEGGVPEVMTWEGRNFDILTGLTAPLVAWWAFKQAAPQRGLLIAWNLFGLALLVNVVAHGILSAPSPFQRFHVDAADFALLRFPFIWLPSLIVPLVLLAHVAALRKLLSPATVGR